MNNKIAVALELHRAGSFGKAEELYNEILCEDRSNPDANHLISLIISGRGDHIRALPFVNEAINARRSPEFLNTRGIIFIAMKKFDEAASDLRAALRIMPDYPEAHNNLSIAYRELGDFRKALEHAKRAVSLKPDFYEGWLALGAAEQAAGSMEQSLAAFEKASELKPGSKDVIANIAKIKYQTLDFDSALALFDQLGFLEHHPVDLAFPYAHILIEKGQIERASDLLVHSFNTDTDISKLESILYQDVFFNNVLYKVCCFLSDIKNDKASAVNLYLASQKHAPKLSHVIFVNIAGIYFSLHRIDDAIEYTNKSIACDTNSASTLSMAYSNLGVFYISKEDSLTAIKCFEKALEINPVNVISLGWLLKQKAAICDWTDYKELRGRLDSVRNTDNTSSISAFTPLSVYNNPKSLKYWATLQANDIFDSVALRLPRCDLQESTSKTKIRVGYYSFDFRNHPVAYLTAGLFKAHDRDKFEIYAYSYGPDDKSEIRAKIVDNADYFVDIQNLTIKESADRIARDQIDILVDLTGNTQHNRSGVFALRPARVQAHWLGFIGTMGTKYYDYIIADEVVAPYSDQEFFTEKIMHLESGFHITDDDKVVSPPAHTKSHYGLPENATIFGCFCQTFKIQPEIFSLWMDILKKVEDSVLWIASGPQGAIENLRMQASLAGVDPNRLIVAERCRMDEYMSRFSYIDVHLDTFPYTSGTVASDSLLAGCPLVTLSGATMVSRMAGSILHHSGLADCVAYNEEEFVRKAIELACPSKRDELRSRLKGLKNSGFLLNTKKVSESLEKAFETMLRSA